MPILFSFSNNISWFTVSKAFFRFMNIPNAIFFSSRSNFSLVIRVRSIVAERERKREIFFDCRFLELYLLLLLMVVIVPENEIQLSDLFLYHSSFICKFWNFVAVHKWPHCIRFVLTIFNIHFYHYSIVKKFR